MIGLMKYGFPEKPFTYLNSRVLDNGEVIQPFISSNKWDNYVHFIYDGVIISIVTEAYEDKGVDLLMMIKQFRINN